MGDCFPLDVSPSRIARTRLNARRYTSPCDNQAHPSVLPHETLTIEPGEIPSRMMTLKPTVFLRHRWEGLSHRLPGSGNDKETEVTERRVLDSITQRTHIQLNMSSEVRV